MEFNFVLKKIVFPVFIRRGTGFETRKNPSKFASFLFCRIYVSHMKTSSSQQAQSIQRFNFSLIMRIRQLSQCGEKRPSPPRMLWPNMVMICSSAYQIRKVLALAGNFKNSFLKGFKSFSKQKQCKTKKRRTKFTDMGRHGARLLLVIITS